MIQPKREEIIHRLQAVVAHQMTREEVLNHQYHEAIACGLGHGGLEAIGGLGLLVLMDMQESIYMPLNLSSFMLLINRPIAMVMHCTLTLVVFYKMFEKKRVWLFVVLAVMLHFFLDFIGGILMWGYDSSVAWANSRTAFFIALFNLFIALTVGIIFRKLYIQNEKAQISSKDSRSSVMP